jgi:hypothetical protein
VQHICTLGDTVDYRTCSQIGHAVTIAAASGIITWITSRLARRPRTQHMPQMLPALRPFVAADRRLRALDAGFVVPPQDTQITQIFVPSLPGAAWRG